MRDEPDLVLLQGPSTKTLNTRVVLQLSVLSHQVRVRPDCAQADLQGGDTESRTKRLRKLNP